MRRNVVRRRLLLPRGRDDRRGRPGPPQSRKRIREGHPQGRDRTRFRLSCPQAVLYLACGRCEEMLPAWPNTCQGMGLGEAPIGSRSPRAWRRAASAAALALEGGVSMSGRRCRTSAWKPQGADFSKGNGVLCPRAARIVVYFIARRCREGGAGGQLTPP